MKKIHYLLLPILFTAMNASANEMTYLNFTVHNTSSTPIFFSSKDLFDLGKHVHKNETKTITYDFTPKIITMKILNTSHQPYNIIIDESCDNLGWPAFHQMTFIGADEDVEGVAMYKAGNVKIDISDTSDETNNLKHFFCHTSITQD